MPAKSKRNSATLWRILVEVFPNASGPNGYFCAYLAEEADANYQPLETATTSISRKGLMIAVSNLCQRLDKRQGASHPPLPAKWQVYLVTPKTVQGLTPVVSQGHLLVEPPYFEDEYTAHLMGVPGFDNSPEEVEQMIEKGILNSYLESTGRSPFKALSNLCQKLHTYGYGESMNSVVLDSLAATFFFPVALEQSEPDHDFFD